MKLNITLLLLSCLLGFIVYIGYIINQRYKNKLEKIKREIAAENTLHQHAKLDLETTQQRLEQEILEKTANVEMAYYKLNKERQDLDQDEQVLDNQTHLNQITGLHNARMFNIKFKDELRRAARQQKNVSLLLCALDQPLLRNSPEQHAFADFVLKEVGQTFSNTFPRASDFCAHINELIFAVCLPNTERQHAEQLAEKIRLAVIHLNANLQNSPTPFNATLSIGGITLFPKGETAASAIMRQVGHALTLAKRDGGNQIRFEDFK